MKRRNFVRITLQGTSTALLLPSFLASCSSDEDEIIPVDTGKKVIILGAGIAGLAAAKYFKDRGIDVSIIEAQDKVGGRLKTNRDLGVAFDEGASWIHGPSGNPITGLAQSSNAETFATDDENIELFDIDGTEYSDSKIDEAESAYEDIIDSFSGTLNQSFEEVFFANNPQYQNDRLWKYQLSAFLEFDKGGDISNLSSQDFCDDEAFSGDDLIITNGFDKVTDFLSSGMDIKLNTKVEGIDYTDKSIIISTDKGDFEADFVLATIPLGVLKQNVISFTPPLPNTKQQAIDSLEMGTVNKFLCVWDSAFWNTDLQYIGYTPDTKGKFNYFLNVNKFTSANALMTFAFGDYSEQTENMSDAEVIEEIMEHLKSIYGNDIPNPTNMLRTKWVSNEFSFGSYSFAAKGTRSSAFDILAESVNEKLFFAGEHTSRDYRGTVHGAFLSGEREAEKIIKLL